MRRIIGAAVAACALLWAGAAGAATYYEITLRGQLVSERSDSSIHNTGIDPNLAVGDYLVMKARFSSDRLVEWGNHGYSMVGFYGLPTTGEEYWRVEGPGGMVWRTRDDQNDGQVIFQDWQDNTRNIRYPAIAIQDGKVLGVGGKMYESSGSSRPMLKMGYTMGSGFKDCYHECVEYFEPGSFSSQFAISAGDGYYSNFYNSQGFDGVWDFDGSVVAMVPEPSTWAMMIVGFGLVGAGLRRPLRIGMRQARFR